MLLNTLAGRPARALAAYDGRLNHIRPLGDRLGLQPVRVDEVPAEISEDDLGVVCWMAVLPAAVSADACRSRI